MFARDPGATDESPRQESSNIDAPNTKHSPVLTNEDETTVSLKARFSPFGSVASKAVFARDPGATDESPTQEDTSNIAPNTKPFPVLMNDGETNASSKARFFSLGSVNSKPSKLENEVAKRRQDEEAQHNDLELQHPQCGEEFRLYESQPYRDVELKKTTHNGKDLSIGSRVPQEDDSPKIVTLWDIELQTLKEDKSRQIQRKKNQEDEVTWHSYDEDERQKAQEATPGAKPDQENSALLLESIRNNLAPFLSRESTKDDRRLDDSMLLAKPLLNKNAPNSDGVKDPTQLTNRKSDELDERKQESSGTTPSQSQIRNVYQAGELKLQRLRDIVKLKAEAESDRQSRREEETSNQEWIKAEEDVMIKTKQTKAHNETTTWASDDDIRQEKEVADSRDDVLRLERAAELERLKNEPEEARHMREAKESVVADESYGEKATMTSTPSRFSPFGSVPPNTFGQRESLGVNDQRQIEEPRNVDESGIKPFPELANNYSTTITAARCSSFGSNPTNTVEKTDASVPKDQNCPEGPSMVDGSYMADSTITRGSNGLNLLTYFGNKESSGGGLREANNTEAGRPISSEGAYSGSSEGDMTLPVPSVGNETMQQNLAGSTTSSSPDGVGIESQGLSEDLFFLERLNDAESIVENKDQREDYSLRPFFLVSNSSKVKGLTANRYSRGFPRITRTEVKEAGREASEATKPLFASPGQSPSWDRGQKSKIEALNTPQKEESTKPSKNMFFSMFSFDGFNNKGVSSKKAKPSSEPLKDTATTECGKSDVALISRWWQNSDRSVTGFVSGKDGLADGTRITTPPLMQGVRPKPGCVVETEGGTRYRLG